jgi:hypothetical protein
MTIRKCARFLTAPALQSSTRSKTPHQSSLRCLRSSVSAEEPRRGRTRGRILSFQHPRSFLPQCRTRSYFPTEWTLARRSRSLINSSIRAIAHGRLPVIFTLWNRISRLCAVTRPSRPHSRLFRLASNRPLGSSLIDRSVDSHPLLDNDPGSPPA